MIKLIATDMDGTLLDSKKRMPADILPVIRALKEQGVSFVIASGRQYAALRRDLRELADDVIFIAENGALIMEKDEQLFIDPMARENIPEIIRMTRGLPGIHPVICRAGVAIVEESAPKEFIHNVQLYYDSGLVVPDILAASENLDDVCKVAFYDEGDAEHHEYPILRDMLGGRHAVILSGYNWVDIMKPGVHKGRAMKILQQQRSLTPDMCMAFGDYLNDMEMLQSVTESYAMENALDSIKAIAKHVAPSNDDNGVVRMIKERFSL